MYEGQSAFQFTPLREGRPADGAAPSAASIISIHAPPRGATHSQQKLLLRMMNFNSRPSARGDVKSLSVHSDRKISIHAPPRGATKRCYMANMAWIFQFTPLREGRPAQRSAPTATTLYFNSRPSARGDAASSGRQLYPLYFNSRPSARGDFLHTLQAAYTLLISIHAPPRGATERKNREYLIRRFQFTPLREGRPGRVSMA